MNYLILNNVIEFEEYKRSVDPNNLYRHWGESKSYPCGIVSRFWNNINGPYTCDHWFIYPEVKWPEVDYE